MLKAASNFYGKSKTSPSVMDDAATATPTTTTAAAEKEAQTMARDYTAIFIYYPNFFLTNVTAVEAYTFFSLLSDVGGALSLLLGATLLTVYETAEFLVLIIANYLHFRFGKLRRSFASLNDIVVW